MSMSGTFNTGVKYTPEGQIIEYNTSVISDEVDCFGPFQRIKVDFKDISRHIYGTTEIIAFGEATKQDVERDLMFNYLNGDYKNN